MAWPAQALRIRKWRPCRACAATSSPATAWWWAGRHGRPDHADAYTTQSLQNYLQNMGVSLPPNLTGQLQLKNVAAVIVTAQLPAFAQPGQFVDVNVSSMATPSRSGRHVDCHTAARRRRRNLRPGAGNLVVGGAGASSGGSKVQINHLSAGRIPQGAQVERSVPTPLHEGDSVTLGLNAPISRPHAAWPRPSTPHGRRPPPGPGRTHGAGARPTTQRPRQFHRRAGGCPSNPWCPRPRW